MKKYFDIYIEFDKTCVVKNVEDAIINQKKGYVCVIDGNVLATTFKDLNYREIINGGIVNTCDGTSIALMAGMIHHKKFETFTGPEIFSFFTSKNQKQFFLGNTNENLSKLSIKFSELGYNNENFRFQSLPFKDVLDFDYKKIAVDINRFSPDIVWVSLGAPKQEIFISKLIPFLDKGILFAIGAAFNLFLGDKNNKRAPNWMRKYHLEWFFRVLQEPKRVGKRAFNYLFIIPKLILFEIKNRNETVN